MVHPLLRIASLVLGAGALAALALQHAARAQAPVSFHREVRPILARRCAGCHQHNREARAGKLSVLTYAALKSGGVTGPGFVSGRPEDSPLYKQVSGKKPPMPKDAPPLAPREVETIRQWILQGARDDTPAPQDPISSERPPVYKSPPVVTALAYSPDGQLLAVAGYREVLLHRADGSGIAARLVGRSQRLESLAFSPDGRWLAAVGGNSCQFGELQLWNVAERKLERSVEIGFDVLYGVSFSPNGQLVAFGSAEKSVYVYRVPGGEQVLKFDNHSDWVFGTTFTRDSKILVTTSRDRAIKSVEIATGNFMDDVNYQVYNGGYLALARNPQSDDVAVAGEEGLIRYYSIHKKQARTMNREDYNLLRTFPRRVAGPVYALAFSPDGTALAEAGQTPEVRIFSIEDGKERAGFRVPSGSVHALAWHPDGKQVAVSGFDGSVRLYDASSGNLIKSFAAVPLAAANPAPRRAGS
jgi:WD40 repeat protein